MQYLGLGVTKSALQVGSVSLSVKTLLEVRAPTCANVADTGTPQNADAGCAPQAQESYNEKLVKGEMPLPSMLHSWHPVTSNGRCVFASTSCFLLLVLVV